MKLNEVIRQYNELDRPVMTPEEIAEKHDVPLSKIKEQMRMGIKIEMKEHTSHRDVAERIALSHIGDIADYYTKLKRMVDPD